MIDKKHQIEFQATVLFLPVLFRIACVIYSGDTDSFFSINFWGFVLWAIAPYAILAVLSSKMNMASLFGAAILMFIVEIYAHIEVFITPSSSTSALLLLFIPVWQIFVFLPVGLLLGKLVDILSKKLSKNKIEE